MVDIGSWLGRSCRETARRSRRVAGVGRSGSIDVPVFEVSWINRGGGGSPYSESYVD